MLFKKSKLKKIRNRKRQEFAKNRYSHKSTKFKRRNPALKKIKKITTLSAVLFTTIFLLYLGFFSSYFNLKNVEILDNSENQNTALNEKIQTNALKNAGDNLILLETEELQADLIQNFPEIEEIKVEKNYPSTLEISFKKYPLVANVINESKEIKKSYIINAIGYVQQENMENTALPYIYIRSDEPINSQKAIIKLNNLKYITELIPYFKDKFGMEILKIDYKPIPREVHILTEREFYIWLDIQIPFEEQLEKLKKALVKLDIYKENLQYIDLRIAGGNGDKIIYKRNL